MKKKTKRIISLAMVFLFVIQFDGIKIMAEEIDLEYINSQSISDNLENGEEGNIESYNENVNSETTDSEAPIFNGLELSKESVKVGESIDIYVDAIDKISGIENITINFYIDSKLYTENFVYDSTVNKYKYTIETTKEMQYKNIKIDLIAICDKAGNFKSIDSNQMVKNSIYILDEDGLTFEQSKKVNLEKQKIEEDKVTIDNDKSNNKLNEGNESLLEEKNIVDDESPKFNSLEFSKDIVKAGESVDIYIDATDEISGIDVVGAYLEIANNFSWIEFTYDENLNKYKYTVETTDETVYKSILISSIYIYDKAGNLTYINENELSKNKIYISNSDGQIDDKEPVFKGIEFSKDVVKAGESLDIYVDASDDISGIEELRVDIGVAGNYGWKYFEYDEKTNKYKYTIETTEEMKYKFIEVCIIYICDKAENSKYIYGNDLEKNKINIADINGLIDEKEPVFNGLEFSKDIIKAGENVDIYIDATDDVSGIERISASLNVGTIYDYVEFIYDENTKKYKYTIETTDDMLYKKITVNSINIYDKAGNYKYISGYDLEKNKINIADSNGLIDDKEPVFNGIEFSKDIVKAGESVDIYIDATDDLSGIESVRAHLKIGSQYTSMDFNYDEDTKRYKQMIDTTSDMAYKNIIINSIEICDKAGNIKNQYEIEKNKINIADSNGLIDDKEPIFNGIEFSKDIVKAGESVDIYIDATDDVSGIESISANLKVGTIYDYVYFIYDENTKKYKYTIETTEDMAYKNIIVNSVNIYDKAGNYTYIYYPENNKINIADTNGLIDEKEPVFNGLEFSKDIVKAGESVDIYIDATDDVSGIESIKAYLRIGSQYDSVDFKYDENTKKYKYSIQTTNDMEYKNIVINSIDIYDKAGNYKYISQYYMISIANSEGVTDRTEPLFKDIKFSSDKVKAGESFDIYIDAKDEVSGIESVTASLRIGSQYETVKFEYNESIQKYKYTMKTTSDMVYKNIIVNYISIYDKAGNFKGIAEYELTNNKINIANSDGLIDEIEPVFSGMSFSKESIKAGESVDIYIDAKDNLSGIESVNAQLKIGLQFNIVEFKYDETINKYKYTVETTSDMVYKNIEVYYVHIYDKAGNFTSIYNLNNNTLNIADNNGKVDSENPTFNSLEFSKTSVKVGESFDMYIDASDDVSGIDRVKAYLNIGSQSESVQFNYDKITNKYKYTFETTSDMVYKTISILAIEIYDKSEKLTGISSDKLQRNKIDVTDKDGLLDKNAPKINKVYFDKEAVKAGDKVSLIVDASDDRSGVSSVKAWLSYNGSTQTVQLKFDETINKYKYEFNVYENVDFGYYEVNHVEVEDNAGNRFNGYYENRIYIQNKDGVIDDSAPTINSYKVDKNTAKVGDIVKLEVDATDNVSGISSVSTAYYVANNRIYTELIYNKETNKYETNIEIDQGMEYSQIIFDHISVKDNAGNWSSKSSEELNNLTVKIPGADGSIDTEAPTINKITLENLSKTEEGNKGEEIVAKAGDIVKISVDATDNKTGIGGVKVQFNEVIGGKALNLEYNKDTKKYEGKITIPSISNDIIKLERISIWDKVNNLTESWQYNYIIKITDFNGNLDTTKPNLDSFSISKQKVDKKEYPVLNLKLSDNQSAVKEVDVIYTDLSGSKEYRANFYANNNEVIGKLTFYNPLYNEKYCIKEIRVYDKLNNCSIYTRDNSDISKLDFEVGTVLTEQKVNIDLNNILPTDSVITGKTSLKNVRLRIYELSNTWEVNLVDETISDENGNFKLNIQKENKSYQYVVEAYDKNTNELLGYELVKILNNPDINEDGNIDILDLSQVALNYNKEVQLMGEYRCDINLDNFIDLYDLTLVSRYMN